MRAVLKITQPPRRLTHILPLNDVALQWVSGKPLLQLLGRKKTGLDSRPAASSR